MSYIQCDRIHLGHPIQTLVGLPVGITQQPWQDSVFSQDSSDFPQSVPHLFDYSLLDCSWLLALETSAHYSLLDCSLLDSFVFLSSRTCDLVIHRLHDCKGIDCGCI